MQTRELEEYCQRRGWGCVHYTDVGISGAKAKRPQLDKLMRDAHQRRFDVLVVWKIDRLGRSLSHLLGVLDVLKDLGIEFVSLTNDIDTGTASGKLMFQMLGAFSEFERSLIQERVRAGLANARSKGILPGPKQVALDMDAVRKRRAAGESLRTIAADLGCSPSLLIKRTKQTAVSHV